MHERLNYNTEVDDLTKINEFFQNSQIPTEEKFIRHTQRPKIQKVPPYIFKRLPVEVKSD